MMGSWHWAAREAGTGKDAEARKNCRLFAADMMARLASEFEAKAHEERRMLKLGDAAAHPVAPELLRARAEAFDDARTAAIHASDVLRDRWRSETSGGPPPNAADVPDHLPGRVPRIARPLVAELRLSAGDLAAVRALMRGLKKEAAGGAMRSAEGGLGKKADARADACDEFAYLFATIEEGLLN